MKLTVILLDKVVRLGNRHDVLDVSKGYAMNYLLPQGLARVATKTEIAQAAERREKEQSKLAQMLAAAQELRAALTGKTVSLAMKVSEKGSLYGSVSAKDVVTALKDQHNVTVTESQIQMDAMKALGTYKIRLMLAEQVEAEIALEITAAA